MPSAEWSGTDTFAYTLDDGAGTTSTATVTVAVAWVNDAQFSTSAEYQSYEGEAIDYSFDTPNATEPLTWAADGLPAGLSMDPLTGHITGRTLYSVASPGNDASTTITVTATGADGDTYSQQLPWNVIDVNRLPWLDDVTWWAQEGAAPIQFAATDLIGNALTYSASNLPPGVTLDPTVPALDGQPTGPGKWVVVVEVSGGGATDQRTFTYEVLPASSPSGFFAMNGTVSPTDDVAIVGGGGASFYLNYRTASSSGNTGYYMEIEGPATFLNGQTSFSVAPRLLPNGFIELDAGDVIVPTDASTTPNDIHVILWQAGQKKAELDTSALTVTFWSGNQPTYDNRIRKEDTPAEMTPDRIAPLGKTDGPGIPTWVAIHFGLKGGGAVNGQAALQNIELQTGVAGGPSRSGGGTPENGVAVIGLGNNTATNPIWYKGATFKLSNLNSHDSFLLRVVGDPDGSLWGIPGARKDYQTQPGHANGLTFKVWAAAAISDADKAFNDGASKPFSIAAIPVAVEMKDHQPGAGQDLEVDKNVWAPWFGISYLVEYHSDSGREMDLSKVQISEVMLPQPGATGVAAKAIEHLLTSGFDSAYVPNPIKPRRDHHGVHARYAKVVRGPDGLLYNTSLAGARK